MDKLPEDLVLEILSRLDNSADVARCRLAWKTFDSVSSGLRSINLQWRWQRYLKSRSGASNSSQLTSPLKRIFLNLVSNSIVLEWVRIGAVNPTLDVSNADVEDNGDDLYLTDGGFVKEWLPRVSGDLKSLSISDFWAQSYWRRSEVLLLVSAYCHNLLELDLKYTWLSVENMNPMPMLTTLTLELIRLDDEDLNVLNKSLPNLHVLNLIGVKGLEQPVIRLLNLKTCHCHLTTSDYWSPSISLITPNLVTLRLEGIMLDALRVEAPLLSHLHLALDHVNRFLFKCFKNLKTVRFEHSDIYFLLSHFPLVKTVETVTLDSRDSHTMIVRIARFTLEELFLAFPNINSLCFNSTAWSQFRVCYSPWYGIEVLKTFRGYLEPSLDFSLVDCVLGVCINLVDVSLLIPSVVSPDVSKRFITKCMTEWPTVKWRWGIWEKGMEDYWINVDEQQLVEKESSRETKKLKRSVEGCR